jgi:hypothetical protein
MRQPPGALGSESSLPHFSYFFQGTKKSRVSILPELTGVALTFWISNQTSPGSTTLNKARLRPPFVSPHGAPKGAVRKVR